MISSFILLMLIIVIGNLGLYLWYRAKTKALQLMVVQSKKTTQGYLYLFRALYEDELEIDIRDSLFYSITAFMYVRKSEYTGMDISLNEDDLELAHKLVEEYLVVWGVDPIIMTGIADAVPRYSNTGWDCSLHRKHLKLLSRAYRSLEESQDLPTVP
ncbi:hypothetical protein COY25_00010 [Candidatus Uhrbacteria bacterium CG_4_10_14_0_2_um_filter_41_7]|nr:MAG: hypothetical protein COY25_00010 [Candidatus Uhrbacteria bacterium CG_4_10_14_0_2_um_filter_41_7]